MKKDKVITIRVTKQEKERLIKKSQKAEMALSEYLIEQGLDKDIIIFDGINEFEYELRMIGNNINQLTRLANSGEIKIINLEKVNLELKKILQKLIDIYSLI